MSATGMPCGKDEEKAMRVAMEPKGVKFNNEVAYIRQTSIRALDLAKGDGCWSTVKQYEANLTAYDNHNSLMSLDLDDLEEDLLSLPYGDKRGNSSESLSLGQVGKDSDQDCDGGQWGMTGMLLTSGFDIAMKYLGGSGSSDAVGDATDDAQNAKKKAAFARTPTQGAPKSLVASKSNAASAAK